MYVLVQVGTASEKTHIPLKVLKNQQIYQQATFRNVGITTIRKLKYLPT